MRRLSHKGWLVVYGCLCFTMVQAAVMVEHDLVYGSAIDYTGSNVVLKLDAYYEVSAETNRPVVILTHGGGFGGGDKGYTIWQGNFYPDIANAFAANGYVAFSINYRLWPGCQGSCTEEVDMAVEDVMTALDWIRTNSAVYGVNAAEVLIAGDSAGGGLAVNASYCGSNTASFLGCISIWGGVPPYGSNVHPVNRCPVSVDTPPTCLIHGTADSVVPYVISENLSSNLTTAGVYNEIHPLEGYTHYPVMKNGVYNSNLVETIIGYMLDFSNGLLFEDPGGPLIRLGDLGVEVSDGAFRFDISGPSNITVEVEQSSDQMESWQAIATNQLLEGSVWFTNTISTSNRFYRVRMITP